jgi:hypothetical protein
MLEPSLLQLSFVRLTGKGEASVAWISEQNTTGQSSLLHSCLPALLTRFDCALAAEFKAMESYNARERRAITVRGGTDAVPLPAWMSGSQAAGRSSGSE